VTHIYLTYHNIYQAFKKLTIDKFEDPFLNALTDEIAGYANCMSLQFVSHLLTYYAMIAPTELIQNYERLNTPFDSNQPISNLFQKIQDARALVAMGDQPYSDALIVIIAFTLICRAWQARAVVKKRWMQFKRYFTVAHQEFCLTNQTTQQSGFHSANMTIEQGPLNCYSDD
jgi:hypothetical protein